MTDPGTPSGNVLFNRSWVLPIGVSPRILMEEMPSLFLTGQKMLSKIKIHLTRNLLGNVFMGKGCVRGIQRLI
jgi:hypothetical protein